MREWRKLYKVLSTSAKASQVSDAALLLYVLMLPHQDDGGRIPWNKAFVRAVTANRDWTWPQTEKLATELCQQRLVTIEGDMLTITKGAELNGKPHDAKKALLYPVSAVVATTGGVWSAPHTEERRGEEKRVEKIPPIVPLKVDLAFEIPSWVNKPLWDSFMEMRKAKGAKNTTHAMKLLVGELDKFRSAGDNPDTVIEQSIMNSWKGVFAVKKGGSNGRFPSNGKPGSNLTPYKDKPRTIYTVPEGPVQLGR